jgi:hypothetical protein
MNPTPETKSPLKQSQTTLPQAMPSLREGFMVQWVAFGELQERRTEAKVGGGSALTLLATTEVGAFLLFYFPTLLGYPPGWRYDG